MDVSDRVAVVVGGGGGIGRGIALVLASYGADVVVADLNLESAKEVAGEVERLGRRSHASVVDVVDQTSVDDMVQDVMGRFGRIDILVNGAGIIGGPGWEDRQQSDEEDWDLIYAVNARGAARVTDAVSPHMKEKRYGKIVNIGSTAARRGEAFNIMYGASKTALLSLTQAAALELAPYNINVNAIHPGEVWTPMWEKLAHHGGLSPENVEGLSLKERFDVIVQKRTPLGRPQTPEDIGNMATFLASDAARNVTGQSINVDGGGIMS